MQTTTLNTDRDTFANEADLLAYAKADTTNHVSSPTTPLVKITLRIGGLLDNVYLIGTSLYYLDYKMERNSHYELRLLDMLNLEHENRLSPKHVRAAIAEYAGQDTPIASFQVIKNQS